MLFMVIEQFRAADPTPVRERFMRSGRMLPNDVTYHASWIDPARARCFQVMQTDDPRLLEAWMANWQDLIDFEVLPVRTSAEAAAAIAPQL